MISIRKLLSTFFVLMIVPLWTMAQPSQSPSKSDVIRTILNQMPLEAQLEESPKDLYQQFSQNPFGLPPSQNEQMMELFREAFTADSLSRYIRQKFEENYQKEQAQTVARWFKNEQNEPLLEAEKEFYTIEGIRQRVVNRYEMEQNPASEQRKELISNLSESMSAVQNELETQVILFRSLVKAFGILSPQRNLSDAQIESFVDNFRAQAQMQIDRETSQKLMLQFHGVNSDLIRDYISFYNSEAGNWLNTTASDARQSAYQQASDQFLKSVQNL